MKDTEQIEEMAQIINGSTEIDTIAYFRCRIIAITLYLQGYRKHPEDSVTLSKGAYERLLSKAKAIAIRKKMAKKFYKKICKKWKTDMVSIEDIKNIAKLFDVEIKEQDK